MLKPGRGILESLADRLGVETPPDIQPEAPESQDQRNESASPTGPTGPTGPTPQDPPPAKTQHISAVTFRISPNQSGIDVDVRILQSRRRQALYVRLPIAMHEYLSDLAHDLVKTNRDASMTNLVAQAILEKFPDCLDAKGDT